MNPIETKLLATIQKGGHPTKTEFLHVAAIAKNVVAPRTEVAILAAVQGMDVATYEGKGPSNGLNMPLYTQSVVCEVLLSAHDGDDDGEHATIFHHDVATDVEYYTLGENFDEIVAFIADQLPA
ncbi:MAG: hypothetical protein ACI9TY_001393 [Alphaproteobacteria bacterium]|jgi:hypothetical protein